ncbi:MAG: hypothetical protein HYX48_07200 [Chlamydiales bacterium]|nr:hypothetical protein [Chlamydiales bacterium]
MTTTALAPDVLQAAQIKLRAVLDAATSEKPQDKLFKLFKEKAASDSQPYLPTNLQESIADLFTDPTDLRQRVRGAFARYYGPEILEPPSVKGGQVEVLETCDWSAYERLVGWAKLFDWSAEDLRNITPCVINSVPFIFFGDCRTESRFDDLRSIALGLVRSQLVVGFYEDIARDSLHEEQYRKGDNYHKYQGDQQTNTWLVGLGDPITCTLSKLVTSTVALAQNEEVRPVLSTSAFVIEIFRNFNRNPLFVQLWEELGGTGGTWGSIHLHSEINSYEYEFRHTKKFYPSWSLSGHVPGIERFDSAITKGFEDRYSLKELRELYHDLSSLALQKYKSHFTSEEYAAIRDVLHSPTNHDSFLVFKDLVQHRKREAHFAKVLCSELPIPFSRSEVIKPTDKVRVVIMGRQHVEGVLNAINASSPARSKTESTESKRKA